MTANPIDQWKREKSYHSAASQSLSRSLASRADVAGRARKMFLDELLLYLIRVELSLLRFRPIERENDLAAKSRALRLRLFVARPNSLSFKCTYSREG